MPAKVFEAPIPADATPIPADEREKVSGPIVTPAQKFPRDAGLIPPSADIGASVDFLPRHSRALTEFSR
jgi:hypothetical protein